MFVNAPAPADVPDNVRSHVGSGPERWAALKRAGAIGVAALPGSLAAPETPRDGASTTLVVGGGQRAPQPTIVLADPELQEVPGQIVGLTVTRRGAEKLFASSGHTVDELDKLISDEKPLPRFPLVGALRAQAALKREVIQSSNVIGIFEGSDPRLKSEYVVMLAHLDHVGVGREINGDTVYNGAMDDASGVASVIEIARLLKASDAKPKRSILFIAVTAEEKVARLEICGAPDGALTSIVADINLDMFLPLYPLKVIEVQGLTESSLGIRCARAKAQGVDVQTDREPGRTASSAAINTASSAWHSVARLQVRLRVRLARGEDTPRVGPRRVHKPNDDLKQTIDSEAAARRVVLGLLQRVANDAERPRWNDTSFFKRFANGA